MEGAAAGGGAGGQRSGSFAPRRAQKLRFEGEWQIMRRRAAATAAAHDDDEANEHTSGTVQAVYTRAWDEWVGRTEPLRGGPVE